jgi:hypothetical protein
VLYVACEHVCTCASALDLLPRIDVENVKLHHYQHFVLHVRTYARARAFDLLPRIDVTHVALFHYQRFVYIRLDICIHMCCI